MNFARTVHNSLQIHTARRRLSEILISTVVDNINKLIAEQPKNPDSANGLNKIKYKNIVSTTTKVVAKKVQELSQGAYYEDGLLKTDKGRRFTVEDFQGLNSALIKFLNQDPSLESQLNDEPLSHAQKKGIHVLISGIQNNTMQSLKIRVTNRGGVTIITGP